jgi:hypothetical protein
MARARITDTTTDLQTDSGSVLWSLIQGEQQEFEVTLNFLTNAYSGAYEFEASVIEAANTGLLDEDGLEVVPTTVEPGGVTDTLNVRVPVEMGAWSAAVAYSREEVVTYGDGYYKRLIGTDIVNAVPPSQSSDWASYIPNKVYLQFPKALSTDWAVQPKPGIPTHGFFELRVTEPASALYPRTWKPMRGMIEFLFSPTELTT